MISACPHGELPMHLAAVVLKCKGFVSSGCFSYLWSWDMVRRRLAAALLGPYRWSGQVPLLEHKRSPFRHF
ncbi:hypothetical protein DPMN_092167 [Dreissena polymorpha]|uniref:Uncharacterized protein n=1 Tax=Dreissena polymorpha TaxID=45954 RepID=A0A9D4R0M1_DREPO|nr:hypothetical protein DPMN_092167 [Dreissena polymorpha]